MKIYSFEEYVNEYRKPNILDKGQAVGVLGQMTSALFKGTSNKIKSKKPNNFFGKVFGKIGDFGSKIFNAFTGIITNVKDLLTNFKKAKTPHEIEKQTENSIDSVTGMIRDLANKRKEEIQNPETSDIKESLSLNEQYLLEQALNEYILELQEDLEELKENINNEHFSLLAEQLIKEIKEIKNILV